ncbi:hypothetical protein BH11BAC5_BH11BAC5_29840 [soil metagenome]
MFKTTKRVKYSRFCLGQNFFINRNFLFTFFVLDTKKVTKKSQVSNEYSPLLPDSFVELLCIVISAFVILLLDLLQLKYK